MAPLPARAQTPLGGIRTVFVILMENHNWSSFKGSTSAPYINGTLLPMASRAEAYFNPPGLHPSLPNYLWLEAGTAFGIHDDADPLFNAQATPAHLVTQLGAAGIEWKTYQESISGTECPLGSAGRYAPRHNPFVYFTDVTDGNNPQSAKCIRHVRPYTELAADLAAGTVARYVFITPNLCSDGHDTCGPLANRVAQTDTWLRDNVPIIMASQAYRDGGAIFITWDEAEVGDGPIGMIALSPFAKGYGYSNSIPYDHGSLLRTLQEIFGVRPLLGSAALQTSLTDLFQSVATPVPTCTLEAMPASIALGGSFTLTARCQPAATAYAWTAAPGLVAGVANTATVTPPAAGTFQYAMTGMNGSGTGNRATANVVVTSAATGGSVVEFYNASLDHYFMTTNPQEMNDLDRGVHAGWARTGLYFGAHSAAAAGVNPVCRFYIPPQHGDSHFFSADPAECAAVLGKVNSDPNYSGYAYETPQAFYMVLPNTTTGACPSGTVPVYRLWNGPSRPDANHRYTTSAAVRDRMLAQGYVQEGYGPLEADMCAAF